VAGSALTSGASAATASMQARAKRRKERRMMGWEGERKEGGKDSEMAQSVQEPDRNAELKRTFFGCLPE